MLPCPMATLPVHKDHRILYQTCFSSQSSSISPYCLTCLPPLSAMARLPSPVSHLLYQSVEDTYLSSSISLPTCPPLSVYLPVLLYQSTYLSSSISLPTCPPLSVYLPVLLYQSTYLSSSISLCVSSIAFSFFLRMCSSFIS